MLDRLTSMEAFVRAVDAGSFTAAGPLLGMSQQMVAKHVAALENRMGMRLLARTTRSQSLTEAGRSYYERCRLVLAEIEAADAMTAEIKGEPQGRLRITAPIVFGRHRLMPMITGFLRNHPKVEIDVVLTDRFVDLVDEGFEVSFRIGELADSTMIARKLAPFRLALCASPIYLKVAGTPTSPSDLTSHECLSYASRGQSGGAIWSFSKGDRTERVRVRRRLEVNETQALLEAALDGYGVLLAPEVVVQDAIASGRLIKLLPDFAPPSNPLHLMYPPDRRQTPKLRQFTEASLKAFS